MQIRCQSWRNINPLFFGELSPHEKRGIKKPQRIARTFQQNLHNNLEHIHTKNSGTTPTNNVLFRQPVQMRCRLVVMLLQ